MRIVTQTLWLFGILLIGTLLKKKKEKENDSVLGNKGNKFVFDCKGPNAQQQV